jgi:hypothetical protein
VEQITLGVIQENDTVISAAIIRAVIATCVRLLSNGKRDRKVVVGDQVSAVCDGRMTGRVVNNVALFVIGYQPGFNQDAHSRIQDLLLPFIASVGVYDSRVGAAQKRPVWFDRFDFLDKPI